MGREELHRVVDVHRQHVADALLAPQHRERLGVEAPAAAHVAQHLHVGQEAHLDGLHALAFARLAAPAGGVEGEAAGACSRGCAPRWCRRKCAGSRPRSRCRSQGRSAVSCRWASDRPPARDRGARRPRTAAQPGIGAPAARRRALPRARLLAQQALEVRVQHVARHGRLAGAGDAGDHDQARRAGCARRCPSRCAARRARAVRRARGGVHGAVRLRRMQQRLRAGSGPVIERGLRDEVPDRARSRPPRRRARPPAGPRSST